MFISTDRDRTYTGHTATKPGKPKDVRDVKSLIIT